MNPSPNASPVKKYDSIRSQFLEATAVLFCGLNEIKVERVDITKVTKSLAHGLFDPSNLVIHQASLFKCLTQIEDCVHHNNKTDVEHFKAILKRLTALIGELSKLPDFHSKKDSHELVSRYLSFSNTLLESAVSKKEVVPVAVFMLAQLAKLPKDLLASSFKDFEPSKGQSVARTFAVKIFEDWCLDYVFDNSKSPIKKEQHLDYFGKFVQAFCSVRWKGLVDLDEIIAVINQKTKNGEPLCNELPNYWKIMAEAYTTYVNNFDNPSQEPSKVLINLNCSRFLLKFPIDKCLNGPAKMWKMWEDVHEKFNEKAPLLLRYNTLEMEDFLADVVLKKLEELENSKKSLESSHFSNLSIHVCSAMVNQMPLQNLSQESPSLAKYNNQNKLSKIVQVLTKLIETMPKFKDKKAANSLANQLAFVISQTTNSKIFAAMLKQLSPAIATLLSLYSNIDTKFEASVKKIHEMFVTKIQSRIEGAYDLELLDNLKPFLLESLGHKKREIKTKTHQMWLLTFGVSIEASKIPNDLKDLIKVQSETSLSHSNSTEGLTPESSFAIPLSFGSIFSKKDAENKTKSSPKSSAKSNAAKAKMSIDEENSQDFVKIQSPSNKKRVLTEHQKDIMRQRRDDIPALYSEISRDDSVSIANIPTMFESTQNSLVDESTPTLNGNDKPEEEAMDTSDDPTPQVPDGQALENTISSQDADSETISPSKSKRKGRKPAKVTDVKELKKKRTRHAKNIDNAAAATTKESTEESNGTEQPAPLDETLSQLSQKIVEEEPSISQPEPVTQEPPVEVAKKRTRGRPARGKAAIKEVWSETLSADEPVSQIPETQEKVVESNTNEVVEPMNVEKENQENQQPVENNEPSVRKDLKPLVVNITSLSPKVVKMAEVSPLKVITESPLRLEPSPYPCKAKKTITFEAEPNTETKVAEPEQPKKVTNETEPEVIDSSQQTQETNQPKRRTTRRSISRNVTKNITEENSESVSAPKPVEDIKIGKKSKVNKFGESPLHVASKQGKFEKVKEIIAEGVADINAKDHAGWTPLHEAAQVICISCERLSKFHIILSISNSFFKFYSTPGLMVKRCSNIWWLTAPT